MLYNYMDTCMFIGFNCSKNIKQQRITSHAFKCVSFQIFNNLIKGKSEYKNSLSPIEKSQ